MRLEIPPLALPAMAARTGVPQWMRTYGDLTSRVVDRATDASHSRRGGRADLRWWLLTAPSATGYGLALAGLIVLVAAGGLGFDARAYWIAGRQSLVGNPLYWPAAIDALGAYFYPPLFAQLVAPLAVLPEVAFTWLLRLLAVVSLRVLAGSWRNVGLWLILPWTRTELIAVNITFPVAAMTFLALRGRPWLAAWAAALKFGPVVILPYLWFARPDQRRQLIVGAATVLAACLASFLAAPIDWVEYFQSLARQSGSPVIGNGLIALLPSASADFFLRLAIAVALVALALIRRSDGLAFAASVIAAPTLWVQRLVPLLAVPRPVWSADDDPLVAARVRWRGPRPPALGPPR